VAADQDTGRNAAGRRSHQELELTTLAGHALTRRFGSELALDAVDLVVDAGEHMAVLGENGAGKTTLLRILATAARPDSGSLEIFGLDGLRERRRLRKAIGFVAHAPGLYPALSASENLEFFCSLHGVSRSRVAEVLALVGLTEVARRPAGELSRGLQQRLALARAVLHDPRLLILDEPDASLDSDAADLLALVIKGRTVVMATHDRPLANRLCQRTLVLRRGRALGAPSRLHVVR
jgi:heme ABC exporter ATP-binding subunit CcmA